MITMDDEYTFEDFGFMCEPGNNDPLTPSFNRKTLEIPGRIGVWDFGIEIREKPFAFPLRIMDRFWVNMQHKFNEFIAFWFDPYGQPREVKIVRDYEPDKFYMVKIAAQIIPERLPEEGAFMLHLVANNPNKQSIIQSDDIITWGDDIPFSSDIPFGGGAATQYTVTSAQTLQIHNFGAMALRPTVEITGSADSLTLTANGKSFSFSSFSNAVITVDGERYTVIKDGQDELNLMTGYFIDLLPGDNNVSVNGNALNVEINFVFRPKYM